MKFLQIIVLTIIASSPAYGATLVYQGSAYTDFDHGGSTENCEQACNFDTTGPYEAGMALSFAFQIDGPLMVSTTYSTYPFLYSSNLTFLYGSDGKAAFDQVDVIGIVVDAYLNISSWTVQLAKSGMSVPDMRNAISTASGDSAGFQWEFGESCVVILSTCHGGPLGGLSARVAGEVATASTSQMGTWTVIPEVPLPAGGLLYLTGLAVLSRFKFRHVGRSSR